MGRYQVLIAALIGLAALPAASSAATISTGVDWSLYGIGDSVLAMFPPELGRLNSMTVVVHASVTKCWTLIAGDTPAGAMVDMDKGSFGFGHVGGVDFTADLPAASGGNGAEAHETLLACVSSHGSSSRTYTTGLEPFIGDGDILMAPYWSGLETSFSISGDGFLEDCHRCGDSTVEATVIYEYSVPEPASWMLMVGGFGLIGGGLRTRRAHLAAIR